jgi:hypothetical protein
MKLAWLTMLIVCLWAAAAAAKDWVYIYQDGQPVGYSVGDGFEFYEVPEEDIHAGNAELMAEVMGYGPQRGSVGYGHTQWNHQHESAEFYGRRKGGFVVNDVSITDYLSPGDWQGIYGDYYDPGSMYFELDKSGPHWSFDSQSQNRYGYILGLDDTGRYQRVERRRRQHQFTWRRGSMDGGVWRVEGLGYELNRDAVLAQGQDVRFKQLQAEFKMVECDLVAQGGVFGGKYHSLAADLDNSYLGGQLDLAYWLAPCLQLQLDSRVTAIDARNQNGQITQANAGGSLSWEMADGLSLTAALRSFNNNSDIAANSHITGYQDVSGELAYTDPGKASVSVGLRHRDVDAERLRLEDPAILGVLYSDPPPDTDALAGFRIPASGSSNAVTVATDLALGPDCTLTGRLLHEEYDELPLAGNFTDAQPADPYFADSRQQASLALRCQFDSSANLALRAEQNERSNSARLSSYEWQRYSLGYSSRLMGDMRWNVGLSHNRQRLTRNSGTLYAENANWNYQLGVSGEQEWADYRFTYQSNLADHDDGYYQGVGVELSLNETPVYFTAWWRRRDETLGGYGNFDDAGANIGYRFLLK